MELKLNVLLDHHPSEDGEVLCRVDLFEQALTKLGHVVLLTGPARLGELARFNIEVFPERVEHEVHQLLVVVIGPPVLLIVFRIVVRLEN